MTNSKLLQFKTELNRVFDDDMHTKQWHNYCDYAIVVLIVISTVEVFLSTYDDITTRYGLVLKIVDVVTTLLFTIEVSLRIWNADMLDSKYKGFLGRVRYCFSFYGLIDVLSTYPFYLSFIMPVPYGALKALRVARLFRVFRYMKSFKLLSHAIGSKKNELIVSLQFLIIVTLILSFILFFVEHSAQPDIYANGWDSVVWAFMQYIGDPGSFADYPPITLSGKLISVLVGILGIAIFAVPAGLIGSGFTEVMEIEEKERELRDNAFKINEFMLVKSVKRENLFWPAKNISFGDLKFNLGLTEEEIARAVSKASNLRVKNLKAAIKNGLGNDLLVVNQFHKNTKYGSCVTRGSSVTIVNPLGVGDNGLSYFDWHVAQLGGFNYVANEFYSRQSFDKEFRYNFYTLDDKTKSDPGFQEFMKAIVREKTEDDWIVLIAGEQIVKNITDFHFEFGGEKGETTFDFPDCIVNDKVLLKQLYDDFSNTLHENAQLTTDAHQVQPTLGKFNIARYIHSQTKANVLLITVSYDLMVFSTNIFKAMISIAEVLNRNLETKSPKGLHTEEYQIRPIDSEYWENLYGISK